MSSFMRDQFDHNRPVTCTVCEADLHWAEGDGAWVDFYGIDVCRSPGDDEYFAHDPHQDASSI